MPNLEAQAAWVPVREIGIELARGGPNGNMNEQATALLARTEWLNQQKASKSEIVLGHYEFNTYAEFNAAKATLPVNCTVIINEMPTGTQTWGQGTNRWNGTTLSKSPYDPLTQAKADATAKANVAEEKAKEYTRDNTLSVKKSGVGSGFFFTDARGVKTWLQCTEDGEPTSETKEILKNSLDALSTKQTNYSSKSVVVLTDELDRVLMHIGGEIASIETKSSGVDLSTVAFFGSSTMQMLQDDVFNLLASNFSQVKYPKYYGAGGSIKGHTLANIGCNNGYLSFSGGVIENAARAVTLSEFYLPYMSTQSVVGYLENGILGTLVNNTFKASEAVSVQIDPDLPIKFTSLGTYHSNAVALVNIGKNNVGDAGGFTPILDATRKAVEFLDSHNEDHTIVLGHFANTDQNSTGKAIIADLNRKLKSLYFNRFIDIQEYLMSEQVWVDVGLTKTTADIDAIAAGVLPPSLARDNAHLSAAIDIKLAEKVLNLVINKGWYA